ncbi:MAG: hypothetical protein D6722_11295, partial [Bacteroidetes bacterium]
MHVLLSFLRRYRMVGIYALLLLAWILRIEHRYHYRNWFLDTEVQLAATAQWWKGYGFTVPEASTEDLSQTHDQPISVFMPGYGWLVIPFFELLDDWFQAAWFAYALAMALMLVATHLIWRQQRLRQDEWPYAAYLIFVGFSPAPWHYLTDAGQWSLTAFAWAVLALLYAGPSVRSRQVGTLLAVAILATGAVIRYAYLPYLLLPALLWSLPRHQWPERRRSLVVALVAGGLGMLSLWLWRVQQLPYLPGEEVPEGWFFHHLLHLDPFPIKAFIYYGIPHELAMARVAAWLPGVFQAIAWVASLFLLGIGLSLWFHWRRRDRFPGPQRRRLLRLSGYTLLLILAMLSYLSLRSPPQDWNWTGFWTYVMETRYFAPVLWLIGLIAFLSAGDKLRPTVQRGLRGVVIAVTLVNLGFGLYQRGALYLGEGVGQPFARTNLPGLMEIAAERQREGPVRVMTYQN